MVGTRRDPWPWGRRPAHGRVGHEVGDPVAGPAERGPVMSGLTVGDVMTREVCVVRRSTPTKEIARQLVEHGVSAMPVLDEEDRLLGVVSEADLVSRGSREVRRD